MGLEQGTKLRHLKVTDSLPGEKTSASFVMAESNPNDSDINDTSDISSQLTEMKENYEKKLSELHSEFSQLKDLMMAVIRKSNEETPSTSSQGLSKQPQRGLNTPQLRVTEKRTISRLKSVVMGFHFDQMSPCRRAPLPSEV